MPPKKATAAASQKKAAAPASHPSYRDMIKEAILALKERNGSSRSAIKKYVLANNKSLSTNLNVFDAQFNKAVRNGVEKNEFALPKGPSGTIKLAKKEPAAKKETEVAKKPAAAKVIRSSLSLSTDHRLVLIMIQKTAAKKDTAAKEAAPKKKVGAPKKATKAGAPKKVGAPKKTGTKAKATANTASKRKAAAPAPAVTETEKVLGKTKTGRVTKNLKPPAPARKAAPKKATAKKAATPKKATPKKAAESAAA
ncbi:MAG: hypothetical protein LQ343_006730 [Gyalolechia ehrenbergii]|nr:MAG: hypothetical protein LQ343_006730 [Gyalolechia ehrenbergii]